MAAAAQRSGKQMRRRRKKRRSRFLLACVFVLLAVAGVAVSLNVYFEVKNFEVSGKSQYTRADVVQASGIRQGQSLLRVNAGAVSRSICQKLPYIKSARVTLRPLSTVIITVSGDTPYAQIQSADGYVVVDRDMKVLEVTQNKLSSVAAVTGVSLKGGVVGQKAVFSGAAKNTLAKIFSALRGNGIGPSSVSAIGLADSYDLTVGYEGRITIHVGSATYLEYKFKMAKYIIRKELSDKSRGSLDVSDVQPDSSDSGKIFFDPE